MHVPTRHIWVIEMFNWRYFQNFATHSYETDTLVNWIEFSQSSRIDEHIWCHHLSALFYKKAASIINYLLHEAEEALSRSRIMDKWWLDPKFSTAQIHIPIPNRKSCQMYENLSFLQKTWQSNAKSLPRITQVTKFEQVHSTTQNTLKYLCDLPNRLRYVFGIFENKLSLDVRSPCHWVHFCKKNWKHWLLWKPFSVGGM